MRRLLVGLILGSLIFGVSFAGAKLATVTNPMSSDLDANYHAITNVSELGVSDAVSANGIFLSGSIAPLAVSILSGHTDPTCCPALIAQPGSVYLERVDDSHGDLWLKTGPNAGDWTLVAGTP